MAAYTGLPGPGDLHRAATSNRTDSTYLRAGRPARAEAYFGEALGARERLPETHPDRIKSTINLGITHLMQGRYADADALADVLREQEHFEEANLLLAARAEP